MYRIIVEDMRDIKNENVVQLSHILPQTQAGVTRQGRKEKEQKKEGMAMTLGMSLGNSEELMAES